MKNLISFVIIGKNERWKLTKCLQSISHCIEFNKINNYEMIYVDSNSTDDSKERAIAHQNVKVFNLVADCNAAIARNVGFANSIGNVLFFIDGDMEIREDFLHEVYSEEKGLFHDFVSGNWVNYFYDKDDNLIKKENFLNISQDRFEPTTGGLFLIKRNIWESVNGMRNMFKKSQDIDLGLRLSQRKVFLLRKKNIAANHHTIAYHDKNRIWNELAQGKHLYGRSLLYKEHWLNKNIYKRIFRNEYTLLSLVTCLILSLITGKYFILLVYFGLIGIRSKFKPRLFLYYFLRDIQVFVGLFLFHPKRDFNVKVE